MLVAQSIFEEVRLGAIALNEDVVRRAFDLCQQSDFCHCPYGLNRHKFSNLLKLYVRAKIQAKRSRNRMLDPINDEASWIPVWRVRQGMFAYHSEWIIERDRVRGELREIWPCESCISRFNPTGRKRPW